MILSACSINSDCIGFGECKFIGLAAIPALICNFALTSIKFDFCQCCDASQTVHSCSGSINCLFFKLSTMCCAEWSLKCSSAEKLPKIGCAVCRIENNEHASLLHKHSRVIVHGLIPSQNDETKHETLASNNFQTLFVAWSWQFASCFFASVRQATFGNTLKRNRRSS